MPRTTRTLLTRGLVVSIAASVSVVAGPAIVADAAVTGAAAATATAVEVFTDDPFGGSPELAADVQLALQTAQERADAKPDDLAQPYVDPATGRLYAPTIHETSADAETPITIDLATMPDEGTDIADEPEDPPPAGEVAPAVEPETTPAPLAATGTKTFYPIVRQVKYSQTSLYNTSDAAIDAAVTGADNIIATYVQESHNRVVVEANAVTEAMRTELASLYGADKVAIYLSPDSEIAVEASRDNDSNPFKGGSGSATCTHGFGWNDGATEYMLTAGHCARHPYLWYAKNQARIGTGSKWDSHNRGVGSVKLPGQNYYVGDAALIEMYGANTTVGKIYTGGRTSNTSRDVASSGPAQKGKKYCTGGQNKGVICNWKITTVRANMKSTGPDGTSTARNMFRGTKEGWCLWGGDSGGPVYTTRGDGKIVAKGLVSTASGGGSDHYAGSLDFRDCVSWFSEVQLAEKSFPGAVTKRP